MFVNYFPNMMGPGHGLLHGVVQARKFTHRIVSSHQEEKVGEKLRCIHPARCDLTLSEEQQDHHEDYADHFDGRGRNTRDTSGTKFGSYNSLRYVSEPLSL